MGLEDYIVDATEPQASGLSASLALIPGSGFGAQNASRLASLAAACFPTSNAISTGRALFIPPRLFEIASTVEFPAVNGIRIIGAGGMPKGLSSLNAATGVYSLFRWTGGTTGPMFRFRNADGICIDNIAFDGKLGPNKNHGNGSTLGLDTLMEWHNSAGSPGMLFHKIHRCGFYNAQRLFYARSSGVGTAEITFDKVIWCNGETSTHAWTSQAFYSDNNQTVNTLFHNNEWNNCGYCVYCVNTGRVILHHSTLAICGTLLAIDGGSQNTQGNEIRHVHIDGGNGSEGRKAYYKSLNANSTMGNVTLSHIKPGGVDSVTDEFSPITTAGGGNGKQLILANPIRMRSGDKVLFVASADRDTRFFEGTIDERHSDTFYTTIENIASAGVVAGTHEACNGEALITCVSSDFVRLTDSYLTLSHMRAGRLARLTHSSFSNGRSPKLVVSRPMGFAVGSLVEATLENLLTKTGTVYWRFEDADQVGDGAAPLTCGNFGVVQGGGGGDTHHHHHEVENRMIRKYAASSAEEFFLQDPSTGDFKPGVTFVAGDVKLFKDGVLQGNTTNLPVEVSLGLYSLTLTAAERTAARVEVRIQDQTVPAAFSPKSLLIDTYGNASAQHELDLDVGNVKADLQFLQGDATGVTAMKRAAKTMATGLVGSGSTVTSIPTTSLSPTATESNQFRNRTLMFTSSTTTAALRGKAVLITDSTSGGVLTVTGMTVAPVSGDEFVIA